MWMVEEYVLGKLTYNFISEMFSWMIVILVLLKMTVMGFPNWFCSHLASNEHMDTYINYNTVGQWLGLLID